jgi:transketolase
MRNAFIKAVYEQVGKDDRVYLLNADIGVFVFDDFKRDFPKRFINLGVAEANMIGVAAGLALSGKVPFVYTIAPFVTMRCLEQIRVDVCLQNLNVKIVGVGAGLAYGALGPTHHAIEDIAIMRALPNITVISPGDPWEAYEATKAAVRHEGPVYIRLAKSGEPSLVEHRHNGFQIGKGVTLREGKDATLIATGCMVKNALCVAQKLSCEGINLRVINMHTIKPIDHDIILESARDTGAIFTMEEHSVIGGLGGAVAEVLAEESTEKVQFLRIGFKDTFCEVVGSREYLLAKHGLDVPSVSKMVANSLRGSPVQ